MIHKSLQVDKKKKKRLASPTCLSFKTLPSKHVHAETITSLKNKSIQRQQQRHGALAISRVSSNK